MITEAIQTLSTVDATVFGECMFLCACVYIKRKWSMAPCLVLHSHTLTKGEGSGDITIPFLC